MKDWRKYIYHNLSDDLWGFILLDYYYTQKEEERLGEPSKFIDDFIFKLPLELNNLVQFHHVLLCVCIHLLGNDFEDIITKSINLIKKYKNKISKKGLKEIVSHYEVYKKSEVINELLKKDTIIEFNDKDVNKLKAKGKDGENQMNLFATPVKLFYSYSHEDEDLKDKIEKHLAQLKREGYIESWHDRKILPGDEFENIIDDQLKEANVILLLISSDFTSSDYCYSKEMKIAIDRHNNGEAIVIPIILRHCVWLSAPFGKLQALPKGGKPIKSGKDWDSIDEALTDVAKGLKRMIENKFSV